MEGEAQPEEIEAGGVFGFGFFEGFAFAFAPGSEGGDFLIDAIKLSRHDGFFPSGDRAFTAGGSGVDFLDELLFIGLIFEDRLVVELAEGLDNGSGVDIGGVLSVERGGDDEEGESEEEFPWGREEMGWHGFRVWGGVGGSHEVSVLGYFS